MDFMSSILQMITLAYFAIYLKEKNWRYFLGTALALSLALLAKLSSLILLPVLFGGGLVYILFLDASAKKIGKYILGCSGIFLVAAFVISSVYSFQTFNMSPQDIYYQMSNHLPPNVYHWIASHIPVSFLTAPIKGIMEYIISIYMLSNRLTQANQQIYFLGHTYGSQGAGLAYFPVLFLAKLSVGFLLLVLGGLFVWIYNIYKRTKKDSWNRTAENFKRFLNSSYAFSFLLLVFIGLYAIPAFSSKLQLGIRYILPIIFAITLLTAKFIDNFWDGKIWKRWKTKYIFAAAMFFMAESVLFSFPYYISYYNFLAGGTANGYNIATDSNYDWGGQDIQKLASWVKDNNIGYVYVDMPGVSYPLEYYLGNNYQNYDVTTQPLPPSGSLVVMSVSKYQFNRSNSQVKNLESNLVARLGTTIFVFRVS